MGSRPSRIQYVSRKDDPVASMLTSVSAGFDTFEPGVRSEGPKPLLTALALAGTTAGLATLCYGHRQVAHSPLSLMVMLPELSFHEIAGPGVWQTHWLVLRGPLADACLPQIGRRSTAIAIPNVAGRIRSWLFEASRLITQQPDSQPRLTHVTALLNYVQERLSGQSVDVTTLVGKAHGLMARHLADPLSPPEIARRLHVSSSILSHQFRQETGVPPGLAYRRMRMTRARQLLAGGLNVSETSRELGFNNPFHFSRLFRRIEGVTPQEFRRRHLQPPLLRY